MRNLILKTAAWRQVRREEGQGVVEYGLVVALVSLILAMALATMGGDVITTVGGKVATELGKI